MDTEYRKHYRELFERHWWWRARTEYIAGNLEKLLSHAGRASILDVGCGEGLFFPRLAQFGEVEGIEVEAGLPADSPWRDRIRVCPFDDSFQPGKRYSVILMLDVLEHLTDPAAALRSARRLLAPGGFFVATVPAFQAAWTNHDVLNQHVRRYTKRSLAPLLERSGFRILRQRYFFHAAFLAKLGVRACERLLHSKPRVPAIPPAWANEALFRFSRLEQMLLDKVSVPFGSSLLALAKASADKT